MRRRLAYVLAAAIGLAAVFASAALAEGYNSSTDVPITTHAATLSDRAGWGALSTDRRLNFPGLAIAEHGYNRGPHGGYTTTTNKCQDCHSTHYAYGSYMLLRANSREAACDFCHSGGGGSQRSIMMDNAYTATGSDLANTGRAAADTTTTRGFGTGHTLGYVGHAPDDIKPAYESTEGFTCFDCHSPHGNSARILSTFEAPGQMVGAGQVSEATYYRFDLSDPNVAAEETHVVFPVGLPVSIEQAAIPGFGTPDNPGIDVANGWLFAWGQDMAANNIVYAYDYSPMGFGSIPVDGRANYVKRPVYPSGTFLLLENPDNENGAGRAGDLATATANVGGVDKVTDGNNKLAIDWENPLGPAATLPGPNGPVGAFASGWLFSLGNDERFPLRWPFAANGLAAESEVCVDCHDGTAGMSEQAAEVWKPAEATYVTAYSHDAQPRSSCRQLYLDPQDGNNFGPNCRNCHTGSGSCEQCHEDPSTFYMTNEPSSTAAYVMDPLSQVPLVEGYTTYQAQAWVRQMQTNVMFNLNGSCLDGGFSYPHRTLGYRMLKDALWGVDFDGTPISAGAVRGQSLTLSTLPPTISSLTTPQADAYWNSPWNTIWAGTYEPSSLVSRTVENLDSLCVDCHGNATTWNGDDLSYYSTTTVQENLFGTSGLPQYADQVTEWNVRGWDLLLKGLP